MHGTMARVETHHPHEPSKRRAGRCSDIMLCRERTLGRSAASFSFGWEVDLEMLPPAHHVVAPEIHHK